METIRPNITDYQSLPDFIRDMISFLKKTNAAFSVLRECRHFRKCSPTLVTLIIKGKRKMTVERSEEMAKLLRLNFREKQIFKDRVIREDQRTRLEDQNEFPLKEVAKKKVVSEHILTDWIHVYVKDAFQLPEVKNAPELIYEHLAGLASQKRIDASINFLLREGYLRKTSDGKIVEEVPLHITDEGVSSRKVRDFHKATLRIAREAIDLYGIEERYANALIVNLDEAGYKQILEHVQEFAAIIQRFSENNISTASKQKLYQIVINLSPTGGSRDKNHH